MNAEVTELAARFSAAKKLYEMAKETLDEANKRWLDIEIQLIEAMVENNTKSVDLEGVGKFTVRVSKIPSVTAASKPEFFEYLRQTGNGGLIKEDVHARTLQAFLRTHVEELAHRISESGVDNFEALFLRSKLDLVVPVGTPLDKMEAARAAADILKAFGASVFEKRDIQFKEAK